MKYIKYINILIVSFILSACASNKITEYDKEGNITSIQESTESALVVIAKGAADKDNIIHYSGWIIGADPTVNKYGIAVYDMLISSTDKYSAKDKIQAYADMIDKSKVKLSASVNKDGIKADSQNTKVSLDEND